MASIASRACRKEFLAKHAEGLIGFSGCLAGEVAQHIMAGKYDEAKATRRVVSGACSGEGISSSRFRTTGWSRTRTVCEAMFRLEKDLNIPLIATNDSHYIADQDDSRAHEILLCVQTAGLDERSEAVQVRYAGVLHQVARRR